MTEDTGTTYFIQSETGGPIKIGYTSGDPMRRIAYLQTGVPFTLKLVGRIAGDVERMLHKRFHWARLSGEWFLDDPDLVEFINSEAEDACPIHDETGLQSIMAICCTQNAVAKFAFFMRHPEFITDDARQRAEEMVDEFPITTNGGAA